MKPCMLVLVALVIPLRLIAYDAVTTSDQSPQQVFQNAEQLPDFNPPRGGSLDQKWAEFLKSANRKMQLDDLGHSLDLSKLQIDWNALWELNRQAESAWNSLLSCANRNPEQARYLYLHVSTCPMAAQKIKALHVAIQSFTASTTYEEIDAWKLVKCDKGWCGSYSIDLMKQILHQPDFPPFHPLLTQMLFEQASVGFPFMWAEYDCLLWTCLVNRNKMIRESPLFGFLHSSSHSEETRKRFMTDLANSFTENSLRPEELANNRFRNSRSSYVALRTLDILSLGRRSCTEFGLWPNATGRLIVAMGSWRGNMVEVALVMKIISGFESFPSDLYAALSASCSGAPIALNWMGAFGWGYTHEPYLDYAWDTLAKAGAWRALNERNENL